LHSNKYYLDPCSCTRGVFGIIEIQRTAAKMSQEKLKIKKAYPPRHKNISLDLDVTNRGGNVE
jgi:hypothetical protein